MKLKDMKAKKKMNKFDQKVNYLPISMLLHYWLAKMKTLNNTKMKTLNSTDSKGLRWLKEYGKYPVSESKRQYVEFEGANDVKSDIHSETLSLIVLGSNLNNYTPQPQPEVCLIL